MASPLAESLAAGDREAFAALYDRLAPADPVPAARPGLRPIDLKPLLEEDL